jgi:folate-binding protein YgfZ
MRTARLDSDQWHHLIRGAVLVESTPAAFAISGSGALTCLQGLLTNDLAGPGENSLVYGALLTPKGAIVVDYWVLRLPDQFLLLAEAGGHAASLELLRRSLPPRLAKLQNRTGELRILWLFGERVGQVLERAGLHHPEHGKVLAVGDVHVARPHAAAPFRALIVGESAAIERVGAELVRSGATVGREEDRVAAEVLAGWPHLGAEIEERTLVQEVRYDEIGGVSYTKGCYTGQETVARLHFRGHTNRELKGLVLEQGNLPSGDLVTDGDGKEVGTLSSLLVLPGRTVALGVLRRSIEAGRPVTAGGTPATITALPFEPARW